MTITMIILLALGSVILIVPSFQVFVFWLFSALVFAIGGAIRRIFGGVPTWLGTFGSWLANAANTIGGRIAAFATIIGWLLVAFVLINVVGITYGNITVLAVEAALIATCAYLLFKFSTIFGKTWGATIAFVLYGLAILGFLWPASMPISPKALVIILLALPMLDILWHVGSRPTVPGIPGVPTWIKWATRTAMVAVIVAAVVAITVTQVGWLNVGWNRVKYENTLIKNQSERQEGLQGIGLSEIDRTDAEIYFWRSQETIYGGLKTADQRRLDYLQFDLRPRQVAAVAKGEPTLGSQKAIASTVDSNSWLEKIRSLDPYLLLILVGGILLTVFTVRVALSKPSTSGH